MLYECWRAIAARYRSEIALRELASGRSWTFDQLASEVERSSAPATEVVFPQGLSADFVLGVIQGWRHGKVVCPLEAEQELPGNLTLLPPTAVHLKTTSASGGMPRLVVFTGPQLAADAANIVRTMGLRPDWPNLGAISLAHSYGFSNLVLPLLLHGVPLWICGAPLPELIRRAAIQTHDFTLPAVPALWKTWQQAHVIPPNVRLAISAGAPLPLVLEKSVFGELGLKIHNFYGSSECGGIAYDRSETPREEATVAGSPLHEVQVSIGPAGRLQVTSPAVASGYWPEPDSSLEHGVFRTSDLGEIRSDIIHLLGRATDQINVAGRKVAPELIERTMALHPAVNHCLVFGVPDGDQHRGEKIVACVSLARANSLESVKQFIIERLPGWQVPREWRILDAMHVNGRGKLSRSEWKKSYLCGATTESSRLGKD
jgi:long-chain acyl-CoA synthetase